MPSLVAAKLTAEDAMNTRAKLDPLLLALLLRGLLAVATAAAGRGSHSC
jgi:hypothetical protein